MIPLFGYGQGNSALQKLMATSSPQNTLLDESRIKDFILELKSNKSASDVALLRKVFHRTQKVFLKEYASYADFSEIFNPGRYDCLTATSLFSVVLDGLNFGYSIVETNYHIFLLVKTSKGEVLLETTDRFNGFVKNEKEIRQRIGAYRRGVTAGTTNRNIYHYSCDLYREVNPSQLPGLLYYNQAVKAYNAGHLEKCGELLTKARSIYDTPRIGELGIIFLKSVVESTLDDQTKMRIIRKLKGTTPAISPVLASR
jgi:hypothetical protein